MRVNLVKGLVLGLGLVAAFGCSTAPTAAPANPAPALPVQPAGGQPVQQLAPVDPCPQPLPPAPLAAPCNPCDGIGGYGPYGGFGPYGYPFGAGVSTVFFDPFAFNSVVFDTVVVRDDVERRNVIRDTEIDIVGNRNKVVLQQGGHGGSRIDSLGVSIDGNNNTVKIKQGNRSR